MYVPSCGHNNCTQTPISTLITNVETIKKLCKDAQESFKSDKCHSLLQHLVLGGQGHYGYIQDNWVQLSDTIAKDSFLRRSPSINHEKVLKEKWSVFETKEEREHAIRKLERF